MNNPVGAESRGRTGLGKLGRALADLLLGIFSPRDEQKHPWLPVIWIGGLILAGAVLWGIFFNWGNVPIQYMDWAEVWGPRLQAWRDALIHNTLPFHFSDVAAMRGDDDRYFSVADMVSSPQVLLLRWVDVGDYSLVNHLLLYGIATYFLLKIRKKYQLSLFSFALLFLLFHFNGFIVTHLSIGHLSWGGYYLFAPFVLLLTELLEGGQNWRWVAKMSFLLFFMFMQGSFHHMVWCLIVLGVIAVLRWRQFLLILKAVLFTALLSMPRIIPAFWSRFSALPEKIDFLGGYPGLLNIFQALGFNTTPDLALPGRIFDSNLGYWEFNIYVGKIGLLFLVVFGLIHLIYDHAKRRDFPYLLAAVIVLGFLSIDDHYLRVLFSNPILVSSERVTSRMMGLALAILIILSVIQYQKYSAAIKSNVILQAGQFVLGGILAYELAAHALRWSVANAFLAFGVTRRDLSPIHVSNHADPEYFTMLGVGLLVSVISGAFLIWMYVRAPGGKIAADRSILPKQTRQTDV